jgi:amidase
MKGSEVWWKLGAVDVVDALKSGRVSPLELVRTARDRILQVDPALNAVPIRCFEMAEERARELMKSGFPSKPERGYLYGLPVLIKDTLAVKDIRFTMGSLLYEHNIADSDEPVVDILQRKGAIVLGKTNTPELGLGSNTYNFVFGDTVNPWDTRLTCGGSSGGSAAAVASGEAWLTIGTDLGGSLRIPASFCSVVGIRPSPGRVPYSGSASTSTPHLHSVVGPMARNTRDLALVMDSICEAHAGDPNSLPAPAESYCSYLAEYEKHLPSTIAWSPTLGGAVPVEEEVVQICKKAFTWFSRLGIDLVEDACMDLSGAQDLFHKLRASKFRSKAFEDLLKTEEKVKLVKPEFVWQVEQGLSLSESAISKAQEGHQLLLQGTKDFFHKYDILCCPCTISPPFDVKTRWLKECAGWEFETYIDWLIPTSLLSLTNCPSICIPCGFTAKSNLPVGLQLMAAPHREAELLCIAHAFERAHSYAQLVPVEEPIVKAG